MFQLRNGKLGVDARAQQIDGEFTMLAGSTVVATWHGVGKAESTLKAYASYRAQREHLVADGAITVEAGRGRVTRNIPFSSPSTAAAVCARPVMQRPAGVDRGRWLNVRALGEPRRRVTPISVVGRFCEYRGGHRLCRRQNCR